MAALGKPGAVTVEYRGKSYNVQVTEASTVKELKQKIKAVTRLATERQGIKVKQTAEEVAAKKSPVRLAEDAQQVLAHAGVTDGAVLEVKDIGPQIGYRTVFIVEYLGPILIMLGYASRPAFLYGEGAAEQPWAPVALLGVAAWLLHFVKRELETLFVHKFSRPTMPLSNLFKNSAYYWGFALGVGYVLCHPDYTAPESQQQVLLGLALMGAAELVNLAVHLQLSGMRPAEGSTKREAPGGPLFALVSCPNYTAEVLSWVGFTIATQIAMSGVFTAVGLAQMSEWALGKHRGYIKADPEYKKRGRKAIIPFLL